MVGVDELEYDQSDGAEQRRLGWQGDGLMHPLIQGDETGWDENLFNRCQDLNFEFYAI